MYQDIRDDIHDAQKFPVELLKLDIDKIQRESLHPVKFLEVSTDDTHPTSPLADVVESSSRIMTILTKEGIIPLVECFERCLTLRTMHDLLNLVLCGHFWNGRWECIGKLHYILDKLMNVSNGRHSSSGWSEP